MELNLPPSLKSVAALPCEISTVQHFIHHVRRKFRFKTRNQQTLFYVRCIYFLLIYLFMYAADVTMTSCDFFATSPAKRST